MPAFTDYAMANRTYRFFTEEPAYPFGFGLTYGDCHVAAASRQGGVITAEVVNEGRVETDEVLQAYVQNEGSALAPRNPRLCAFRRIRVPAGETVRVTMTVEPERLKVIDASGAPVDDGTPVFYVGLGQPDARTAALTGHSSVVVK